MPLEASSQRRSMGPRLLSPFPSYVLDAQDAGKSLSSHKNLSRRQRSKNWILNLSGNAPREEEKCIDSWRGNTTAKYDVMTYTLTLTSMHIQIHVIVSVLSVNKTPVGRRTATVYRGAVTPISNRGSSRSQTSPLANTDRAPSQGRSPRRWKKGSIGPICFRPTHPSRSR